MSDKIDRPKEFINKTLLGLLCGSLGFGLSQLTVASEVKVHSNEISNILAMMKEERARTDARIFELVALLKENIGFNRTLIDQNREFLADLRAKHNP